MKWIIGMILGLIILGVSDLWAECTWILWRGWNVVNVVSFDNPNTKEKLEAVLTKQWVYLDAFSNKEECQMAKKIERESFFSDRRGVESKSENGKDEIEVKLKEDTVTVWEKSTFAMTVYEHKCIPDTIDPRFRG